jgi:hypothetical protein
MDRVAINPDQLKDKSFYYRSFKIEIGDQPGTRFGSWFELIIILGQHKNKNDYYHSFKTRLGDQLKSRLRSHVVRVNSG